MAELQITAEELEEYLKTPESLAEQNKQLRSMLAYTVACLGGAVMFPSEVVMFGVTADFYLQEEIDYHAISLAVDVRDELRPLPLRRGQMSSPLVTED